MPLPRQRLRSGRRQLRRARAASDGPRARRARSLRPNRGGFEPPLQMAQGRAFSVWRSGRHPPGLKRGIHMADGKNGNPVSTGTPAAPPSGGNGKTRLATLIDESKVVRDRAMEELKALKQPEKTDV